MFIVGNRSFETYFNWFAEFISIIFSEISQTFYDSVEDLEIIFNVIKYLI